MPRTRATHAKVEDEVVSVSEYQKLSSAYREAQEVIERLTQQIDRYVDGVEDLRRGAEGACEILTTLMKYTRLYAEQHGEQENEEAVKVGISIDRVGRALDAIQVGLGVLPRSTSQDTDELREAFGSIDVDAAPYDPRVLRLCDEVDRLRDSIKKANTTMRAL